MKFIYFFIDLLNNLFCICLLGNQSDYLNRQLIVMDSKKKLLRASVPRNRGTEKRRWRCRIPRVRNNGRYLVRQK